MNFEQLQQLKHRDDLGEFLNRHGLFGRGVEVGCLRGDYARTIISKWRGTIGLVDLWAPQLPGVYKEQQRTDYNECHEQCRKLMAEFEPRVWLCESLSPAAALYFSDGSQDFVYIDANHSYEAVANDIMAWWPKVNPGGIIGGHDYCLDTKWPAFMEVQPAVDAFASFIRLPVHITTEDANKSWWMVKP